MPFYVRRVFHIIWLFSQSVKNAYEGFPQIKYSINNNGIVQISGTEKTSDTE